MTTRIILFFFIVSTFCVFLAWTNENDGANQNKITPSEQSKELAKLVSSNDLVKIKQYFSDVKYEATKQVSDVKHEATQQVSDVKHEATQQVSDVKHLATQQVSDVKHQATLEVSKEVSAIRCKLVQHHMQHKFISYVECAFQNWKPMLELIFRLNAPEKTHLDTINIPSMPEDIVKLNKSCDEWIDNYDPKEFPAPLKATTTIESASMHLSAESAESAERNTNVFYKRCRREVETYYKQWYYYLTTDKCVTAKRLRKELSNHAKHYQDFYKDQNINVRFAARIARSYILSCTMHHRVLPDLRIYFLANPKEDFAKKLFDVIPSWYLDEETLLYVNILRSVIQKEFSFNVKIGGDISCLPAINPEKKKVCIPYLDLEQCTTIDLATHLSLGTDFSRLTPTTPLPPTLNLK